MMKQISLFDVTPLHEKPIQWTLYIDGASRNNPGPAGVGVYLLKQNEVVQKMGCYIGLKTNNQAEYLALLLGLYVLKMQADSGDCVHIISDSQLLVRQLQGLYKIKNEGLRPLFLISKKWLCSFKWGVEHVLRHDNTIADALANKGIEKKGQLPDAFVKALAQEGVQV